MRQTSGRTAFLLFALCGCAGTADGDLPDAHVPDAGSGDRDGGPAPEVDASVVPEEDASTPAAPERVYVTAMANYRVVTASSEGLVATAVRARASEELEVLPNDDGTVSLRATDLDRLVAVGTDGRLRADGTERNAEARFERVPQPNGGVALRSVATDRFVSADLNEGAVLVADRTEVAGWEIFFLHAMRPPAETTPDFGPHVTLFDPSTPTSELQARVNAVFAEMEENQFGDERHALLFAPGTYDVDVNVGFYTQIVGLGASPEEVVIRGAVRAEADWFSGNATQNFWRGVEGLAIEPSGGTNRWAVSQAAAMRRVHVRGDLVLDDGGWASGGFLADAVIDGTVASGSQQQWLTRSSELGRWTGRNWNMVFVGVENAPEGAASFPDPPYTVVDEAPVLREKPSLVLDALGYYGVFVPAVRHASRGSSWHDGSHAGRTIPIDAFHVVREGDSVASMNAALAEGRHLLVTPGVYRVGEPLEITRADTVVLGLGLATLRPEGGATAVRVADVDGVVVAGLLIDAGETSSSVLMQVGEPGASADHAANPISLHDLYFRVGGAAVGRAEVSLAIHSDDVIADHMWIWRGDHSYGIGWNLNTGATGLVVEGDDVTAYGLFVEHYQRYQTIWNGERGRTYFYQNEIPYDVPDQASWMNGGTRGYAAYHVGEHVTSHEAWGLGSYCFFNDNPSVVLEHSFEAPRVEGVRFHHMVSVSLGGRGTIARVINDVGEAADPGHNVSYVVEYP